MLITPHAAVGAAILLSIPEKGIAFPLAFLSHLILDSIPHWDFTPDVRKLYKLIPDVIIMLGVLILMKWLSGASYQLLATGAALAILPDIIQQLEHFGSHRLLEPFFKLHNRIQRSIPVLPGIVFQLMVVLSCLLLVA